MLGINHILSTTMVFSIKQNCLSTFKREEIMDSCGVRERMTL